MAYEIKEPNAPATSKQTWTIFKLGGGDVREDGLTRQTASDKIQELMAAKGIDPAAPKSKGRDAEFNELWEKAKAAGLAAGDGSTPTPMRVVEHVNPFNDNSPVKTDYGIIADGACGFAWVNVKPGTSRFARWLKKNDYARTDSYEGGVTIWIGEHNQSVDRKSAHAHALANVLTEAGHKAYASSRLD